VKRKEKGRKKRAKEVLDVSSGEIYLFVTSVTKVNL